jgi:CubicO group peptidase (beta-lactamase class C family)
MRTQLRIKIGLLAFCSGLIAAHAQPRDALAAPPLSWDNLAARIDAEVEDGFAGALVVVRDGEIALEGAYGYANREKKIRNRMDTIFAIGSTPIDFTHVGILMLLDQGKLKLSDPIETFFDDIPADKRAITVEHLMTGRSGLQNFHGVPEDGNPDHPWIDRNEAMRRIFAQKLLFSPGEGNEHSHSAWGVLAAILEIVSGESYQEFTTKRIFEPLGMKDTGFFGEPYDETRMAVGYGHLVSGEVNAPSYWGKTSWLVLGSGGQVSTVGDMLRFVRAMNDGKLLSETSHQRFQDNWGGILAGGDAFGFEIVYTTDPQNMMILISNYNPPDRVGQTTQFAEALALLSLGRSMPRFSLGVRLEVDHEQGVTIAGVVEGSAAERDGLQAGDRLIGAGGTPFDGDPLDVLDPFLSSGDPIEFEIERAGKSMKVTVKPDPR